MDCQERCSVLRLDFKKLTMSSKSDVSHSASTRPCWRFPFKLCVSFPGDLFIRCYVNALTCNSVFFDNHFWKLAISLDAYKPHDHETSWHFSWLRQLSPTVSDENAQRVLSDNDEGSSDREKSNNTSARSEVCYLFPLQRHDTSALGSGGWGFLAYLQQLRHMSEKDRGRWLKAKGGIP